MQVPWTACMVISSMICISTHKIILPLRVWQRIFATARFPGNPAKYPGPTLGMDEPGWRFYAEQHEQLIQKVLADGEKAKDMTREQAASLVSEYEQTDRSQKCKT